MNTPLERNLQALDDEGNVVWEADLKEQADDTDPDAGKYSDDVPTFHGLSRGGDVTGKVSSTIHGLSDWF
jgi:N-acetylated-alpha-linked acidic dipeptidase